MSRANRRHHRFRIREKAKRIMKFVMGDSYDDEDAVKRADHLATCSCNMCGNPRKFYGEKTRQEFDAATDFDLANEQATDHSD